MNFCSSTTPALPSLYPTSGAGLINSTSVLVALLDTYYTEISELIEKALLLQTLEETVGCHNLTVFAPRNEALDPEFKRFLLEPRNIKSLQTPILLHFVPTRIPSIFPSVHHRTFASDKISLSRSKSGINRIDLASIVFLDAIIRLEGVIHGIDRLLVARSVQEDFICPRNLADLCAVLPVGAP